MNGSYSSAEGRKPFLTQIQMNVTMLNRGYKLHNSSFIKETLFHIISNLGNSQNTHHREHLETVL